MRRLILLLICLHLFTLNVYCQHSSEYYDQRNYKEAEQFKNFHKRKRLVAAWQIQKLKVGALVVRLRISEPLLKALVNKGEEQLRERRKLQQQAINYNICRAFTHAYKFSKVYFMYSNYSDSLLHGKRSGIFLDTNLVIDPSIRMEENFYLISDADYSVSSSIGFMPEVDAPKQIERGAPIKYLQIVIKNKYGHQLKGPFPYTAQGRASHGEMENMVINGREENFLIRMSTGQVPLNTYEENELYIPANFVFVNYLTAVQIFNLRLEKYLIKSQKTNLNGVDENTRKYLY